MVSSAFPLYTGTCKKFGSLGLITQTSHTAPSTTPSENGSIGPTQEFFAGGTKSTFCTPRSYSDKSVGLLSTTRALH